MNLINRISNLTEPGLRLLRSATLLEVTLQKLPNSEPNGKLSRCLCRNRRLFPGSRFEEIKLAVRARNKYTHNLVENDSTWSASKAEEQAKILLAAAETAMMELPPEVRSAILYGAVPAQWQIVYDLQALTGGQENLVLPGVHFASSGETASASQFFKYFDPPTPVTASAYSSDNYFVSLSSPGRLFSRCYVENANLTKKNLLGAADEQAIRKFESILGLRWEGDGVFAIVWPHRPCKLNGHDVVEKTKIRLCKGINRFSTDCIRIEILAEQLLNQDDRHEQ
ncbi:MAG: hypothetical protein KDB03_01500 [Planctomycetales bacterium]|nr:hypothetical protein [Planctomycetales bacterium]